MQLAKLPRWQDTVTVRALFIGAILGAAFSSARAPAAGAAAAVGQRLRGQLQPRAAPRLR